MNQINDTASGTAPAQVKEHSRKAKKAIPNTPFRRTIGLLIVPLTYIYLEFVTKAAISTLSVTRNLAMILIIAAAFGFAVDTLACLIPSNKVSKWVLVFFQELITVWFLVVYFTNSSHHTFFDLKTVFGQAGNVAAGFSDQIVAVFVQGGPMVLLYELPVLLTIIFNRQVMLTKQHFSPVPAIAALLLACGLGLVGYGMIEADSSAYETYTTMYKYDNAVRELGVLTALQSDIRRLNGTTDADNVTAFDTVDMAAVSVPSIAAPAETETPAEAPAQAEGDAQTEISEGSPASEPEAEVEGTVSEETAEEPETEQEPEPVEYGYNVMNIDFDALMANTDSSTIQAMHEYVQSLTPSKQNKYTGAFKGKNLILITAEAFCKEVIDPERTPTLYRLATEGILFEDFYQPAWGGSTSTGEYSFLTGLIPYVDYAMLSTPGKNMYFTMGNQLQRLGYYSCAYHNGTYDYYSRNKTHKNLGYSDFIAIGSGMEKGIDCTLWPESDLEMMEYTLSSYIDQQPFSIYYMTISGHACYSFSSSVNSMAVKNEDVVADLPYSSRVRAYLAANQELENALTYLVNALEEAGIADDTVIALCPDHYPYGLEESEVWGNDQDYLKELFGYTYQNDFNRDHSTAIIWCGCMEDWDEQIVISEPSYSLDLLPTLSNLFGLEYDSRLLVGRDVLSDDAALVIWPDKSWKTSAGYYLYGEFHANEGYENLVDDSYVAAINTIVKNKITFSSNVLTYDYYRILFGDDEYN